MQTEDIKRENLRFGIFLAPYHQDPYYWMMCNRRDATYVGLFAEGEHPDDDLDLVRNKIDDDLRIDIPKLRRSLDLID